MKVSVILFLRFVSRSEEILAQFEVFGLVAVHVVTTICLLTSHNPKNSKAKRNMYIKYREIE